MKTVMLPEAIPQSEPLPPRCDVVVIGGGAVGAMITLHLAEAGVNVVCLEAETKNFGSSLRSAACSRQQFLTEENVRLSLYSTRWFEQFRGRYGGSIDPICQIGYHFLYHSRELRADHARVKTVEDAVERQRRFGLQDVEYLEPPAIRNRYPYLNLEVVACSTFCPTDGFCRPDVITNDGFEAASRFGAKLFQRTRVTGLRSVLGDLVVETTRGQITADTVVNACGLWAPVIAATVGTELPIRAVKRYLYHFRPADGRRDTWSGDGVPVPLDRMPMTITPNGAYARPDGTAVVMAGWDEAPDDQDPRNWIPVDVASKTQDDVEPGFDFDGYGMRVAEELSRHLPFLIETGAGAYVTCGYYEITPDHSPIIDRDPNLPSLIHCAGFSGHGIMHSPAAGRLVSEMVSQGKVEYVDPYAFSLAGLLRGDRPRETMVL